MDNKVVYDSLRQELKETYNRQVNLITFTFTATAAIIGYGFNAHTPLIFLLPIVILWLSLMQLNNNMYGIFTASIYIREYIEATSDIAKWEQDIGILRDHLRKKKPFKLRESFNPILSFDAHQYAVAIKGMWIACIGLCFWYAIYWHYAIHLLSSIETLVALTFSIMAAVLWITRGRKLLVPISFINSGEFEEELPRVWKEAKANATIQKRAQEKRNKSSTSKKEFQNKDLGVSSRKKQT